jgi:hypothetical protein
MDQPFYLLSNASKDVFPENTLTEFKNVLPKTLHFPDDELWTVGIETIGLSSMFRNVRMPPKGVPAIFAGHLNTRIDDYREEKNSFEVMDTHKPLNFQLEKTKFGMYCELTDKYYTKGDVYSMCSFFSVKLKPYCKIDFDGERMTFSFVDTYNLTKHGTWVFMHEAFAESFHFTPHIINKLDVANPDPTKNSNDVYLVEVGDTLFIQRKINMNGQIYYGYLLTNDPTIPYHTHLVSEIINLEQHINLPEIIKIRCDIIEPQILNSQFSQDLLVLSPDLRYTNNYFFHEIEKISYIPLAQKDVSIIKITLVDENNEMLQLVRGHATIVKLRFQRNRSMSENFYCRVTSKRNAVYKHNTPHSFSVQLPSAKILNEDWKVSLNSINVPNLFTTFLPTRHRNYRSLIYKTPTQPAKVMLFKKDVAYTPSRLVADINIFFNSHDLGTAQIDDLGRLVLNLNEECSFAIGMDAVNVLGYESGTTLTNDGTDWMVVRPYIHSKEKIIFERPINVNYFRPNYFIIYSNIVQPSIIGNQYSPILKIVPVLDSKEPFKLYDFKQREFYHIANTEITEIKMELRTHDGEYVNFLTDQNVVMNLQFSNEINPI